MAPRLIHLNGPPGSGKSTVAAALAAEWPLLLVVEIDELRTRIGGWESDDLSKVLARDLAVAMIETHLAAGHDVIVPQYLGRPEFVERLVGTAQARGAEFHELVLDVDPDVAADRFLARRAALSSGGVDHPEQEVADEAVPAAVEQAIERLARLGAPGVRPVRIASPTVDGVVIAVRRAIER